MDSKSYISNWFDRRYTILTEQFHCQIHILTACQYNCVHCYFHEIPKQKQIMSMLQVQAIISNLKQSAHQLGLSPSTDLTGGDPLLHPHFFDILAYAKEQKVKVGIKCNPDLLLKKENLQRLRHLGLDTISLSLDGLEPIQDAIRGQGSFLKTIAAIGKAKDEGLRVRVHTTVSKFNLNQLIPIIQFFLSNRFIIDDLTWSRYWSTSDPVDMINRKELLSLFGELIAFYDEIFSDPNFFIVNSEGNLTPRIFIGFKEHLWFPYLQSKGYIQPNVTEKILNTTNSINCTATQYVYIIDPDGTVYKCRKIKNSIVGNIFVNSFEEMNSMYKGEMFLNLEEHVDCGSCRFFNGCGGCAAITIAKTGSFILRDPDCPTVVL